MLLMELFTKSGVAKAPSILQHVETFLSDPLSGKLLIFAHHKKVLDAMSAFLARRGTDFMRIDGSTVSKTRHQRMLRFQTVPTCRVAVLAITAAGE
jgi:SWI/SNF-related matrix-associated actin-dependent regulator 1 of chromatin subfamily A